MAQLRFILRIFWRILIFLLGCAIFASLTYTAWPYTDSQPAFFFGLLLLYCLMAYVVIPNLMRLFHVFSRPNHVPLYVTTGDGWPSDPVNLALIVKNRDHLERRMNSAGWHTAHPLTFKNGFRELLSIVFNRPYPEAPLSNLYLFDRAHDIGFEIPTNDANSARTRHHVRFWRLEEPSTGMRNEGHYHFWRDRLQNVFSGGRELWIGAATEETHAVDVQWRTGRLTHGGSHDSDKERDFILQTLSRRKFIKQSSVAAAGETLRFRGQQIRTFYVTDGSIKVARLR